MSWAETWSLTSELALDPSSHVGAALGGLVHPVDLATVVLADLWDLTLQAASTGKKKLTPYRRGWLSSKRAASRPALTQDQIREALRLRGHDV